MRQIWDEHVSQSFSKVTDLWRTRVTFIQQSERFVTKGFAIIQQSDRFVTNTRHVHSAKWQTCDETFHNHSAKWQICDEHVSQSFSKVADLWLARVTFIQQSDRFVMNTCHVRSAKWQICDEHASHAFSKVIDLWRTRVTCIQQSDRFVTNTCHMHSPKYTICNFVADTNFIPRHKYCNSGHYSLSCLFTTTSRRLNSVSVFRWNLLFGPTEDKIQSPKRGVLNKDRKLDSVQKGFVPFNCRPSRAGNGKFMIRVVLLDAPGRAGHFATELCTQCVWEQEATSLSTDDHCKWTG
jgi:hypothetical protein